MASWGILAVTSQSSGTQLDSFDIHERVGVAERNLERVLDWISRFDNRSPVLLGIITGMLGVLSGFAPPPEVWTQEMIGSTSLTIVLLAGSFIAIYFGSYPRLKGSGPTGFHRRSDACLTLWND